MRIITLSQPRRSQESYGHSAIVIGSIREVRTDTMIESIVTVYIYIYIYIHMYIDIYPVAASQ